MRVRYALSALVATVALSLAFANTVSAAGKLRCGARLTGPTTVVLKQDVTLTCPDGVMFFVGGGATLDLNGHTVTCHSTYNPFIRVGSGTLMNGTVAGCNVSAANSRVTHLTLAGSPLLIESGNTITGNTSQGTPFEFMLFASGNTLIGNTIADALQGFYTPVGSGRDNTLIGNVATDVSNTAFGFGDQVGLRLLGNRAERSITGFAIVNARESEVRGNVATGNLQEGFVVYGGVGLTVTQNVAMANGSHGFLVYPAADSEEGTLLPENLILTNNHSIDNRGHGIHVIGGPELRRVTDNTALGHRAPYFDLADDDPKCKGTLWRNNVFQAGSPKVCIR